MLTETLLRFGVEKKAMTKVAKTGLYVDIMGTGPPDKKAKVKLVALRTDLDGLPMPENN